MYSTYVYTVCMWTYPVLCVKYLADEEKLETARQQMLANMDQYANMMPGFKVWINVCVM